MIQPIISIIVATYNSQETIRACLSSIYAQKNDLVEVILIDGASSDSTMAICDEFELNYSISEPDNGIYDAWNKGVTAAKGQWIMFIGSDDMLCKGALENYLSFVKGKESLDYISSKVRLIDSAGTVLKIVGKPYLWKIFRRYMNVAHAGSLQRATLYETFGLYDETYRICGDYELLLRPQSKLQTDFMDSVSVDMRIGGVSYASKESLLEAKQAKLKHSNLPRLIVEADYIVAMIKLSLKSKFSFYIK